MFILQIKTSMIKKHFTTDALPKILSSLNTNVANSLEFLSQTSFQKIGKMQVIKPLIHFFLLRCIWMSLINTKHVTMNFYDTCSWLMQMLSISPVLECDEWWDWFNCLCFHSSGITFHLFSSLNFESTNKHVKWYQENGLCMLEEQSKNI